MKGTDDTEWLKALFPPGGAELFGPLDLLLAMTVSALLAFVLSATYRYTHRGTSYSQSFLVTMVLMAVATSVVMLIIGSNIARAFSLVGALSIIRFRTAVKDPKDTGYLFTAIVQGMGCGTGFYLASVGLTGFIAVLMVVLHHLDFGLKQKLECIVRVTFHEGEGVVDRIEEQLADAYREFRLINRILEYGDGEATNVYVVQPGSTSEAEVEERLGRVEGVVNLSLYQSDPHAPF